MFCSAGLHVLVRSSSNWQQPDPLRVLLPTGHHQAVQPRLVGSGGGCLHDPFLLACRVIAARRPQRVLQLARMPSDTSRYQAQQCALPFCLADPCLPSALPHCGASEGSAWRPRFASVSLWGVRTAACKPTASGWRRSSQKCDRRCASECLPLHSQFLLSRARPASCCAVLQTWNEGCRANHPER